jgi:hypothetical protein
MFFTLVRHNMWTVSHFPLFRRGLEPIAVDARGAALVKYFGGVLFFSREDALDAAEGFMYPAGDMARPADPRGDFVELPFLKLPLFIPEFSGDLIAA